MKKHIISATILASLAGLGACSVEATGDFDTRDQALVAGSNLYAPGWRKGAKDQYAELQSGKQKADAQLIKQMANTPQAVWLTGGTPAEASKQARQVTNKAADDGSVPVLVAYNIPFRDCAQFSAGGATNPDEYKAWIDGVAAGIDQKSAIVILEPDGLGIIPWYTTINGELEWCQPAEADPATAAEERFDMLKYAVATLTSLPNVDLYLDGTHSAWLGVGDISDRLAKANVELTNGFYLNASNYQFTANLVQYGSWISKCLASGNFAGCANQYWNGGPDGTQIADLLGAWTGVALSNYGEWSDDATDPALNTSGINARFAGLEGSAHFVIDTSRNGQGPWLPPADHPPGDAQDWCNPPDRGLGLTPSLDTGLELVDGYLWIKVPGESDGQCNRWAPGGSPDPVRGMMDPAAGVWFPEQALELVHFAEPAF